MFRSPMTLDRANRRLTLFVSLLLVAVTFAVTLTAPPRALPALALLVVALLVSWAMAPRALAVDADSVWIERRMWRPLRVPRVDIESAAPLDSLGRRPLRLFGVGGFFGSYGLFSSDKLGRFRLWATRGGQAVIIVRKGALLPMVVTPDDVAGTIGAIDTRSTGG